MEENASFSGFSVVYVVCCRSCSRNYVAGTTDDQIAAEECGKMEAALRAVAVENEPRPAKINWNC